MKRLILLELTFLFLATTFSSSSQDTNQNAKLNFAQSNYLNVKGYKNNLLGQSSVLDRIKPESFMADACEFKVTSHFNILKSYYQLLISSEICPTFHLKLPTPVN